METIFALDGTEELHARFPVCIWTFIVITQAPFKDKTTRNSS